MNHPVESVRHYPDWMVVLNSVVPRCHAPKVSCVIRLVYASPALVAHVVDKLTVATKATFS